MSSVDVYQESDGRWRWQFRDGEVDLKSNRTYGDQDSAARAARIAYPDQFRDPTGGPRSSSGLIHKISSLMTIALAVTVWRRRQTATT